MPSVRGDLYLLKAPKVVRGHEQASLTTPRRKPSIAALQAVLYMD